MQHRGSIGNRAEQKTDSLQRIKASTGIIHGGDIAPDSSTNVHPFPLS
ncbi:hypothetical protein OAH12_02955 [Cyclobacteriaceae bacterium]|nr:hypothetical protein [Cyclobacteriaceae bacterium]